MEPVRQPSALSSSQTMAPETDDAAVVKDVEKQAQAAGVPQNTVEWDEDGVRIENGIPMVGLKGADDPDSPLNFSTAKKWTILVTISLASFCVTSCSSQVAFTYSGVEKEFGVSSEVATLGLSLFVMGLGIGPLFLGPLSEFYGRRPIYVIAYFFFVAFNFQVAFAHNIETWIIGRFLCGLAGSAFLSVAGGSVSDMFAPHQVGAPMGVYTSSPFLGPVAGPIIAGFENQHLYWRWTWYIFLVWAFATWVSLIFLAPETYVPAILVKKAKALRKKGRTDVRAPLELDPRSIPHVIAVSCTRPFELLVLEPMALVLCLWTSILLGILYMFFSGFTIVYTAYGFNQQTIGLTFIGIGIGIVFGTSCHPYWASFYRKVTAATGKRPPPEEHLRKGMWGAVLVPLSLFWFAFTTYTSVHWSVSLVSTVFFGIGICWSFQVFVYLVDAFRPIAASAMAANSAMRSSFAADAMFNKLGTQWALALCAFLTLAMLPFPFLFLVGTVVVLSTVVAYFGVDTRDVITEAEMRVYERLADQAILAPSHGSKQEVVAPANPIPVDADGDAADPTAPDADLWAGELEELKAELVERSKVDAATSLPASDEDEEAALGTTTPQPRIPRIIHQTWKTADVPERWAKVRQGCLDLHPDYEYMLWTDESSREFIATHYPWFLQAFDGYPYPIQRADAIRYFVLHHYGGIYMDLDIGCRRSMDPLLYFEVVLPATIPVGVSNDLMLAEKGHQFMDLVIHNLVTFNHQYGTNYPTVMFSTGPMFLSAQYGLWPKDDEAIGSERQVRILPRRWYGKNAPATEMGDSFFDHFYGSSWHADDAGFLLFLGKFGMILMYLGLAVVILGALRLAWTKRAFLKKSSGQINSGPIALPFHFPNEHNRPGTPGSRPGSPYSRSATPTVPQREGRGVLYYLPVWFMPNEEQEENRYQPIPDFSRPPSPSNNSILHAPGAVHDGAFSGVHLHSINSPTPSSPPAYSAVKSWGSNLFRTAPWSSAPKSPVLPTAHTPGSARSSTPNNGHARSDSTQSTVSQGVPRSRSAHGHSRGASTTSARGESPRAPLVRARSPLPPQYSSTPEPRPVAMGRSRSSEGANAQASAASTQPHQPVSSATLSAADGDELDSGTEYESTDGRGVEEEVDRLLSELVEPSSSSKDE
ncbi:MFS transporter [Pseudohyphozyma bogoriensis]|nr:MFS transporter [Pseudohyphozyma bogoriensis]